MAQSQEATEKDNTISPTKIVAMLHRFFQDVPTDTRELLVLGSLTERQADALLMFVQDESLTDISVAISNSKNTQNANSALSAAVKKILQSLVLMEMLSKNKNLLSAVIKRELAVGSAFELKSVAVT
jgi:hypothetical protein